MDVGLLFTAVRRHYLACLITLGLCVGAGFLINQLIQPQYRAQASLVANLPGDSESGTYNEFLASQMLTKTYEDAIQSRYIANEVKQRLNLKESVFQLLAKIEARTDPGTLVILLQAVDDNPKQALRLANAFADAFILKSKEIVHNANIRVLDYADPEETAVPVSPKKKLNLALSLFIGIGAALCISLLLEKRRASRRRKRPVESGIREDAYPGPAESRGPNHEGVTQA
ncbi:hypothetical protein DCC85_21090 [Paenibacillus sp. CAA11]|uniref:YveK family protein n=1 Tax=Paenibacillus sp. CAA11 TaxID=1532905 RepID=UPI000D36B06D|nr:Wzz/FepE/Etk N-terminal domain-containing protein [Paenibacillus sp. CAA11]AWB46415.1 hypothetical protein DCC85_21090 [Paenibacillus sp. CAA11]